MFLFLLNVALHVYINAICSNARVSLLSLRTWTAWRQLSVMLTNCVSLVTMMHREEEEEAVKTEAADQDT
jgi:hypothetical protein